MNRRSKKSQNKAQANVPVESNTVKTEGETVELANAIDASQILPPNSECVEQTADADVAKTDESLPETDKDTEKPTETDKDTEKPTETDKMDDDSEETLATEDASELESAETTSVKLRLEKAELGSNNFHYTQTYRKANKKYSSAESAAMKQKHQEKTAELLADVIIITKSYDSDNTEIEQQSKLRYCFSGILQGTVAYKRFRENFSRQTINQTRNRASFCSGHPYQILTLPDGIWENGYSLLLDYLHGQEIELKKAQFKDFASAVIFFGGKGLNRLREKLPSLARDLGINYVNRVVNELRLLKKKVRELGLEIKQDMDKNADESESSNGSEELQEKCEIIETIEETVDETIDETADDQTKNGIVKPDETMDETDSKELENKPTETEEADIKPLTARQTKLISYLSSEDTESNDMLDRKNLHARVGQN